MYYVDEIRQVDEFRTDTSLVKDKELEMAKMLIQSLAEDFEPEKYHDTYRDEPPADDRSEDRGPARWWRRPRRHVAPVIDIMEALKRSLAEKRKPVQAASAAAQAEEQPAEAPKKRARRKAS